MEKIEDKFWMRGKGYMYFHIWTVWVCADRKLPIFQPTPLLKTPLFWHVPFHKNPLFKNICYFMFQIPINIHFFVFSPINIHFFVFSSPAIAVTSVVRVRVCVPVTLRKSFICKFCKSSYLDSHSSERIHIWTIGTLEGQLSFHES